MNFYAQKIVHSALALLLFYKCAYGHGDPIVSTSELRAPTGSS